MSQKRQIVHVYRWQNEMVMVFDQNGKQIPKYQGEYSQVKDKILKDASPDTKFFNFQGRSHPSYVNKEDW